MKGGRKDWAKLKRGCTIGNRVFEGVELDLILMGVDKGKGKRRETFGSYLFGTPFGDRVVPVCKVGTGLSEQELYDLSGLARKLEAAQKPDQYAVPEGLTVDMWCQPSLVCEISSQEFTRSPLYELGRSPDGEQGGLSLRFPKFVRRREDKTPKEATSGEEILGQAGR